MIATRKATAQDQSQIRRMIAAVRLDPTSLKWRHFLLAHDTATGALIGCAQIKRHRDCNEFGSLAVLPAYRKRGVGGRLLRELVQGESGPLYLVCLERMRPYYERFGFRLTLLSESPRTLKIKQILPRMFGVRIVCMRIN